MTGKNGRIWRALDEYAEVLHVSSLTDNSVQDYFYFAECFVRWMDGDFTPGQGRSAAADQPGRRGGDG